MLKLLKGTAFVVKFPSELIKQKQGLSSAVSTAASGLEFTVLVIATLAKAQFNRLTEVATLVKSVKKFLNLTEVLDNSGELARLAQKATKPYGEDAAWVTAAKVASSALFTVASGMEVFEFVARISGKGLKVLNFTCKGLNAVPVFGLVKDAMAVAGIAFSAGVKGYEVYSGVTKRQKNESKLEKWKDVKAWLKEADSAKKTALKDLQDDYEKKITKYKNLAVSKEEAREAADEAAEAPAEETDTTFGKKPKLSAEEHRLLAVGKKKSEIWKARVDLLKLAQAEFAVTREGEQEPASEEAIKAAETTKELFENLVKIKKEKTKVKAYNYNRFAIKAGVALALNVAKIGLIVMSSVFLFAGWVGLPFTLILLGASFAINVGGLVNYSVWEQFIPEKKMSHAAAAA
ncbi:hypothetical protein [Parachlamydia sp. AcF125]|uniref:hypothetical protein n=1 Tax=Parachlamydia sp. AcF125 TaxID=2795736 RepID=UPI001BC9370F|nr:hypothetical protein [Parachlamydia sp. AcF125]